MTPDEAFDKVWNSLVDVEEYLQVGVVQQLKTTVSFSGDDMIPVHEAFRAFRRVDPYISQSVRSSVESSFESLQSGLNAFLDSLRTGIDIPKSDSKGREDAKAQATQVLNRVLYEHRTAMRCRLAKRCIRCAKTPQSRHIRRVH